MLSPYVGRRNRHEHVPKHSALLSTFYDTRCLRQHHHHWPAPMLATRRHLLHCIAAPLLSIFDMDWVLPWMEILSSICTPTLTRIGTSARTHQPHAATMKCGCAARAQIALSTRQAHRHLPSALPDVTHPQVTLLTPAFSCFP